MIFPVNLGEAMKLAVNISRVSDFSGEKFFHCFLLVAAKIFSPHSATSEKNIFQRNLLLAMKFFFHRLNGEKNFYRIYRIERKSYIFFSISTQILHFLAILSHDTSTRDKIAIVLYYGFAR